MSSDSRSAATAFTPFNCNMLVSVVAFARVDQISYLTASGVAIRVDPGSCYWCECLQGAGYDQHGPEGVGTCENQKQESVHSEKMPALSADARLHWPGHSGASEEGFEQAEEEALT